MKHHAKASPQTRERIEGDVEKFTRRLRELEEKQATVGLTEGEENEARLLLVYVRAAQAGAIRKVHSFD